MARIRTYLGALGIAAFALEVLAPRPVFASGHAVYPPGWNTPTTPGPVIYTFDPVDLSMHHVHGAPELKPAYGPIIYQFTPQSLRMHRVP
ncbi:MAG TPA: hypothetical protein VN823_13890 [Stellaceae bacterium]|nr:hypothetical protein [Stellaceae bacterium]